MRHNKTRRGGSKTGKKNAAKKDLLSSGETYRNNAFNQLLTPFQQMNLKLRDALRKEPPGKRITRSMTKTEENESPDLLIFPKKTSSHPHTSRKAKSPSPPPHSPSPPPRPPRRSPPYIESQVRLLCGKHAFNNVVGAEVMTLQDIFTTLEIPAREQRGFVGDIDNYDLQAIINQMRGPRQLYSAFTINSINSVDDVSHEPKNAPLNDEKRKSTKIWTEPVFRGASEAMKDYIRVLYESFLMLLKYTPDFSGLIFQVNHDRYSTGHYIAIRKLPTGQLQMIDSIGPTIGEPIHFMTDDLDQYRRNCAALIQMLFKKAGLGLKSTEAQINTTVLNILVVKPREPGNATFY
jgi:hypothetical protein